MSPFNIKTIQKAIYDWITSELEMQVVWETPNVPRPKTPHASLNFIAGPVKIGHDGLKHLTGEDFEVRGQRTMTLNIQVHGPNAFEPMLGIHASMDNPVVLEALRKAGIAIWTEGAVSDVSLEVESGIEDRFSMDVIIGVASNITVQPGYIDKVEAEGNVEDEEGGDHLFGPVVINE